MKQLKLTLLLTFITLSSIAQTNPIINLHGHSLRIFNGRVEQLIGNDIEATSDLVLGKDGITFGVVGNLVTINGIDTTGWISGSEVFLIFKTGTIITVKNGGGGGENVAPIYLKPSEDWEVQAGANIRLMRVGNSWIQLYRND